MSVPEHVTYWREIFNAIENKRKCKVRSDYDLAFLAKISSDFCCKSEDSNALILNKDWNMAYFLTLDMKFVEKMGDGRGHVKLYSVKPDIRFMDEGSKGIDIYMLPENNPQFTNPGQGIAEHLQDAPAYMKQWCDKGKPTGIMSLFLEDTTLIDTLEKRYSEFIKVAESITKPKSLFAS